MAECFISGKNVIIQIDFLAKKIKDKKIAINVLICCLTPETNLDV